MVTSGRGGGSETCALESRTGDGLVRPYPVADGNCKTRVGQGRKCDREEDLLR